MVSLWREKLIIFFIVIPSVFIIFSIPSLSPVLKFIDHFVVAVYFSSTEYYDSFIDY